MRYLLLSFCIFVSACATSPIQDFEEVRVGMDKSDVLQAAGSPLRQIKRSAKHVWFYRFYDENKQELWREVQFENGRVSYVGERVTKEKIINPVGSSYTQTDLEDFLKTEDKNEKQKVFQDNATMEQEIKNELSPKGKFKPIQPD